VPQLLLLEGVAEPELLELHRKQKHVKLWRLWQKVIFLPVKGLCSVGRFQQKLTLALAEGFKIVDVLFGEGDSQRLPKHTLQPILRSLSCSLVACFWDKFGVLLVNGVKGNPGELLDHLQRFHHLILDLDLAVLHTLDG